MGLGKSVMTLFRSIIGGIDIGQAAHPLAHLGWFFSAAFCVYLAFMIFGVLNVLTGIFCDAAMQAAQSDRANVIQAQMEEDESLMNELRDIFAKSDQDGSGKVSQAEFDKLLENPDVTM